MNTATMPGTTRISVVTTLSRGLRRVVAFFKENPTFTVGLVLLLALYLFGLIGSGLISPRRADMGGNPLNLSPTWEHPLGQSR